MKDTGYDHNDGSLAIGNTGILWTEADYIDMTVPFAAGGLYSTVEDLYRWDQALYTEQLVPQDLLDVMFTPHAKMLDTGLSYGYGWYISEMNNHNVVGHDNRIEGFITEIRHYIDDKVTIIVISNRDSTGVGNIANLIAQAVFEKQ
jgi:CubicO group peptidase (beta-lactamase class C family)